MLKKEKKTHQSPSSKTKADEERKNWSRIFFFFFRDCEYRGLEFWGLVGRQRYQRKWKCIKERQNKRIRSKERDSVG